MKKTIITLLFVISILSNANSQVYIEKQTRHRFAQLNLGIDYTTNFGGKTSYLDSQNKLNTLDLKNTHSPRIVIGGTHFWGHADFYIAIPLFHSKFTQHKQTIQSYKSIETAFKFYPWRIEHNKIRPFLGISMAPIHLQQNNENLDFTQGPELNHITFPILSGFTYLHKKNLLEIGLAWHYQNKQQYYISENQKVNIKTPPLYLNISFRRMIETTISAEKSWESGKTQNITEKLAAKHKLNGLYLGVGISSAFWLQKSTYNTTERPYIEKYNTAIMPDFGLGYYFHKPDLNIALAYRNYKSTTETYSITQTAKRQSLALEITKFLFDYHGFTPFLGPVMSHETLKFTEKNRDQQIHDMQKQKLSYGITFGWDIRPNRIQSWILRTNLRWFPNLNLNIQENTKIAFSNLEFNFIQLIIYPNRLK